MIGQSGVERRYDAFLRGVDGIDAVTVDAFGQPTGAVRHLKAPVPGRNVRLTIDLDTQRAAEQALAYGVRGDGLGGRRRRRDRRARSRRTARCARSPRIPTFDPNWFVSYRKPKFQRQLARISRDGGEPRALPAARPRHRRPLSGGLDVQAVRRDRGRQGAARHAGRRCCAARPSPTTTTSASTTGTRRSTAASTSPSALERSCDTYFYHLGDKIFRESGKQGHPLQDWAAKFGFGSRTGIDIVGEDKGLLPDPDLEDEVLQGQLLRSEQAVVRPQLAVRLELERRRRDQPLDRAGQPQRHAAAARGRLRRDRERRHRRDAARRQRDPGARTSRRASSRTRRAGTSTSAPRCSTSVRSGLLRATHQPAGTATNVFGQFEIPVAGKTGTAQRAGEPDYARLRVVRPATEPAVRHGRS